MAYNFAGGGDGDQVFLMPPDPRDWLPEGHLAWAMRRAAGELDLAPFLAAYRADGQGKAAYHPRMMVALVMYCYCQGDPLVAGDRDGYLGRRGRAGDLRRAAS